MREGQHYIYYVCPQAILIVSTAVRMNLGQNIMAQRLLEGARRKAGRAVGVDETQHRAGQAPVIVVIVFM